MAYQLVPSLDVVKGRKGRSSGSNGAGGEGGSARTGGKGGKAWLGGDVELSVQVHQMKFHYPILISLHRKIQN